jgi:hypothetical protein
MNSGDEAVDILEGGTLLCLPQKLISKICCKVRGRTEIRGGVAMLLHWLISTNVLSCLDTRHFRPTSINGHATIQLK